LGSQRAFSAAASSSRRKKSQKNDSPSESHTRRQNLSWSSVVYPNRASCCVAFSLSGMGSSARPIGVRCNPAFRHHHLLRLREGVQHRAGEFVIAVSRATVHRPLGKTNMLPATTVVGRSWYRVTP